MPKKHPVGGTVCNPGNTLENKTGTWRVFRPIVDKEKCIGCKTCEMYCPDASIVVDPKKKKAEVDYDYCKGCLICADVCPVKCIKKELEEK